MFPLRPALLQMVRGVLSWLPPGLMAGAGWSPYVALEGPFARHPKLLRFSRSDRWAWVELLCYCAEYRTNGILPPRIQDTVRAATPKLLRELVDVGLLDLLCDEHGTHFAIHDWDEYNGTGRERREAKDRKRAQREQDDTRRVVQSGQWAKTREAVFERDDGVCAKCGKREVPGWNAHHTTHRADLLAAGLDPHDISHIETLCHSCHSRETRLEAIRRAAESLGTDQGTDEGTDEGTD